MLGKIKVNIKKLKNQIGLSLFTCFLSYFYFENLSMITIVISFIASINISVRLAKKTIEFKKHVRFFIGIFITLLSTLFYVYVTGLSMMNIGGEGAMIGGAMISIGGGFIVMLVCFIINLDAIFNS